MLEVINDFLSGKVLIVLIVGLGSYFTIRSRFVQLRHFFHMFAVFRDSLRSSAGQLSSFQALMLSLAGRVGAGNIAGVGIAVTLGGPGAVFWMWMTALVGMSSSFFECSLGQLYKRCDSEGQYRGGPSYYIDGRLVHSFASTTPISDVQGIEVYRGAAEMPAEFTGDKAMCGVIAIWTRAAP